MTLLDLRPPRLDLYVRPGDDYSVVLNWPESLEARTFEASLLASELDVEIDDTVMTILIPDSVTGAVASGATWELRETTGGVDSDVTLIAGQVVGSLRGTTTGSRSATVEVSSESVTVTIVGGVTGAVAAVAAALAAHLADAADAHDASAVSTTAISGLSGSDVQAMLASAQANITAKVADAINDGTTGVAPSQNAVFDALVGKQPADPTVSVTYNADGSVATSTENGVVTTITYNADGSVSTTVRLGVTRTYSYNADGSLAGVA